MSCPSENIECKTLWAEIPWTRLRNLEIGCPEITPILNKLVHLNNQLNQENIYLPLIQFYIKKLEQKQLICPLKQTTSVSLKSDETKLTIDQKETSNLESSLTLNLTSELPVEISSELKSMNDINKSKRNNQRIPNRISFTQLNDIYTDEFNFLKQNIISCHIHISLPLMVMSNNNTLEIMNINIDTRHILHKSTIQTPIDFTKIQFHNILPLILCYNGHGEIFIYSYNIPTRTEAILKSGMSSSLARKLIMNIRGMKKLDPSVSTADTIFHAEMSLLDKKRTLSKIRESKYIREKIDLLFKISYTTNINSHISSFHPTLPIFIKFNQVSNSLTVCRLIDNYSNIVELFVLPMYISNYYTAFHPNLPILLITETNSIHIFKIEENFTNATHQFSFKYRENTITAIKFHNILPVFIVGYDDSVWTLWSLEPNLQLITWSNSLLNPKPVKDFYFHHTLPIFGIIYTNYNQLWQNSILSMSQPYKYLPSKAYLIHINRIESETKDNFYFHNNLFVSLSTIYINQPGTGTYTKRGYTPAIYSGQSKLKTTLYDIDPLPKIFITENELRSEINKRFGLLEYNSKEDLVMRRWDWHEYHSLIHNVCDEQEKIIMNDTLLSGNDKKQKIETLHESCKKINESHHTTGDLY